MADTQSEVPGGAESGEVSLLRRLPPGDRSLLELYCLLRCGQRNLVLRYSFCGIRFRLVIIRPRLNPFQCRSAKRPKSWIFAFCGLIVE